MSIHILRLLMITVFFFVSNYKKMQITKTKLFLMTHSQLVSLAENKKINVLNSLGTYLPHVTLQTLIWDKYMLDNNITEIEKNSRDLQSSWYVLHVINGQEQIVMQKINTLLTNNSIDRKNDLVNAGYINKYFRLSDYILDIGFPREYDLQHNKQCQAYNTYVFVEIDKIPANDLFTGQQIFNSVFLPLLQHIEGVKNFVGTYEKVVGLRRTEIIRMNKREKLSRKQVEKIKPSKLPESDYLNIERSHSSFSYYEEKLFNVSDVCWFTPDLTKQHNKHLVKVVKVLTYDKFQVVNNIGHKYAVSVNNLQLAKDVEFKQQENKNLVVCSKVKPLRHKLPTLTKLDKRELNDSSSSNIMKVIKPVTVTKVTRLPDITTPINLYRQTSVSR